MKTNAILLVLMLLTACRPGAPSAEFYPLRGPLDVPLSEAVRVGDMLYLSGQIGTDSNGRLVPGGMENETRQALENIDEVLRRHGPARDKASSAPSC